MLAPVTTDTRPVWSGICSAVQRGFFCLPSSVVMWHTLSRRPAAEPPAEALRQAVWVAMAACADGDEHSGRALRVVQLILRTPALRARFLEHQAQWRDDLAVETAHRLGLDPETDLSPRLAAEAALAAFDTALRRWSDSDGAEDPAALTDRAFAFLAPALDAAGPYGVSR
ncbi:TetR family transcriptional regulator [Streptomyces anulatus]|uniref:acyl-CoA-like ligand-binding transcription factor n=1 Tax=Streptomyces anulatus TaxID=1892 RepID=UPI0037FC3A39